METITKLIKALFFTADGEVEKSAVQKIKDWLLMLFVVEHLLLAGIYYMADDDEQEEVANVELVDE